VKGETVGRGDTQDTDLVAPEAGDPPPSEFEAIVSYAVLPARRERIERVLAGRTRRLVIVVENLQDRHNLSAVMRSAEGFGLQEVHVVWSDGPLQTNAKVTQGCHKWLDVVSHPDAASCVAHLRGRGYQLWAAALAEGARSLTEIDFSGPVALVLGNESLGLSPAMQDACDGVYVIPMRGFVQSFNISVAAAVSLFYATLPAAIRGGGVEPDLPPQDVVALRKRWLELSVKQGPRIRALLEQADGESPAQEGTP